VSGHPGLIRLPATAKAIIARTQEIGENFMIESFNDSQKTGIRQAACVHTSKIDASG